MIAEDRDWYDLPNQITGQPRIWDSTDSETELLLDGVIYLADYVDAQVRLAIGCYVTNVEPQVWATGSAPAISITPMDCDRLMGVIDEDGWTKHEITENLLEEGIYGSSSKCLDHWERLAKYILMRVAEERAE